MQLHNRSERLLRPSRPFFVWITLFAALLLNLLPTSLWYGMPDWVVLLLCIWGIRESRLISMGWAFSLGILMDVADASVLGQHALAYVLVAFGAVTISRRVLWFPLTHQGLHALPLLLAAPAIQVFIRYAAGEHVSFWPLLVSPFVSAALWVPVTFLLLLPQLQPQNRDDTRPI